jgi:hypothetical protein
MCLLSRSTFLSITDPLFCLSKCFILHVFVYQCFCNLLSNNLNLQQLRFDCPAALSPQQLFFVRAAVRISANMRSYEFRFGTMILNNDSTVMFGLHDRQQFRKALGLSILSGTELDYQSDLETHFCVPTEVVAQTQRLLGEGRFGCVYSCELEGREVCVKEPKVTNYNVVQVQFVSIARCSIVCA